VSRRHTIDSTVGPQPNDRGIESVEEHVQAAVRGRARSARVASVVAPVVTFGLILVIWEVAVRAFDISVLILPAPTRIATEMAGDIGILAHHGLVTTTEILTGYLLSILVGIPLALVLFFSPILSRAIFPLIVSSQLIPKVAIAPLFVIWLGFGPMPKVIITFLISFFPITISTMVGLNSIQREKVLLARSMGMGAAGMFWRIRLPQALPSVFAGLKIAVTLAVIGAVVGEFVGSDSGLGYLLLVADGNFNTPLLFASIIVLTAIGVVGYAAVVILERLTIPWYVLQTNATRPENQ